ncbi:MAG: M6 family metalloprotease domain-containing protein [Dehalococcoidia bacterium]
MLLFVDFSDAPATDSTASHEALLLPAGPEMLRAFSYGALTVDVTVFEQWYRMPQPSTAYGFQRGITFPEHQLYFADAVAAADAAVDFSEFDLVWVMAAREAAAITFSPAFAPTSVFYGVVADRSVILNGVTFGQDVWLPGWGHNVLVHETGHLLDLPDLYAYAGTTHRFMGEWDVMGQYARGPELLAWLRWKLGWIEAGQMRCLTEETTETVTLSPVTRADGVKFAAVRLDAERYVVVESRRREGYDNALPAEGVLVYLVDISIPTGEGPITLLTDLSTASLGLLAPGDEAVDPSGRVVITFIERSAQGDVVSLTLR